MEKALCVWQRAFLFHGDRLCQIARSVNVAIPKECGFIRQMLHSSHGSENAGLVPTFRKEEGRNPGRKNGPVFFPAQKDNIGTAAGDLPQIAGHFFCKFAFGAERNDGRSAFDEGNGTVLEFSRRIGFTVQIGNLLELERSLHGQRIISSSSDIKKMGRICEGFGKAEKFLAPCNDLPDNIRSPIGQCTATCADCIVVEGSSGRGKCE